ncbi:MAG: DUF1638 domain-containing protein [Methanomassiliicoccus sp.]|nr:DUF1638 domain-containing protein [Methanomassiliicoccus sp.]
MRGKLRIAIIACDHFKRELEALTEGDGDFVLHEYLEYHLHENPKALRETVIDRIDSLEGKVDAVLLGYGTCGSLKGVEDRVKVPTVMFKADDCIAVYLTQEVYDREKENVPLTYYSTPYFSEMDMEWHHEDWNRKMGMDLEDEMFHSMFTKLFDGYSRSIYVHTIGERECFERKAKKFADELSLRFESRDGTLTVMREAIEQVKELARQTIGSKEAVE